MGIHKLTEKGCSKFIKICEAAGKRGILGDGGGLYLCAGPTGTASWLFRYEKGGKRREMGLGAVHTFTLGEAREKARLARQLLHQGGDPLAEKRRAKAATVAARPASKPFKYCAGEFLKSRESNWRSGKHRQDFVNSLATYAYPVIGDMAVSDIGLEHVLQVLQPHWDRATETMMRLRGRLELIITWAIGMKLRTAPNPAVWKGNLDAVLDRKARKPVRHLAALPYEELPALTGDLQQDQSIAAKALAFGVYSVLRTNEIVGLKWDHVDFATQSLNIPAGLMKMNRPHRVPLAEPALAILTVLAAVRTASPYVFTTGTRGKPLPEGAMRATLRRLRPGIDATVHGSVRAGFSTWRAEETGFAEEVAESCLAHIKKDKVAEAYNRGTYYKKRCEVMAAWARFCTTPIGGNITPLRQIS